MPSYHLIRCVSIVTFQTTNSTSTIRRNFNWKTIKKIHIRMKKLNEVKTIRQHSPPPPNAHFSSACWLCHHHSHSYLLCFHWSSTTNIPPTEFSTFDDAERAFGKAYALVDLVAGRTNFAFGNFLVWRGECGSGRTMSNHRRNDLNIERRSVAWAAKANVADSFECGDTGVVVVKLCGQSCVHSNYLVKYTIFIII